MRWGGGGERKKSRGGKLEKSRKLTYGLISCPYLVFIINLVKAPTRYTIKFISSELVGGRKKSRSIFVNIKGGRFFGFPPTSKFYKSNYWALFPSPPHLTYTPILCCNEEFYKAKYVDQICLS